MEIRQATNFMEVLELQKILDSKVKSCRERDLTDIKLSLTAEIIEFNEECEGDTHKTWKTDKKIFSLEKAKKEAIDILFFTAQLLNGLLEIHKREEEEEVSNIKEEVNDCFHWEKRLKVERNTTLRLETLWLLKCALWSSRRKYDSRDWTQILGAIVAIYKTLGMTEEEVYKRHFEKWQDNYYNRIGKEWN